MKNLICSFLFLGLCFQGISQAPDFSPIVKKAMTDLSVMCGQWNGSGWQMGMDGSKSPSFVEEDIQFLLDSVVIQAKGIGRKEDGTVVHNALGIMFFDPIKKVYFMESHLSSGMSTKATLEVIEANRQFKWWFEDGHGGTITYEILIENDTWIEKGFYSRPGMDAMPFFEMTLKKVK